MVGWIGTSPTSSHYQLVGNAFSANKVQGKSMLCATCGGLQWERHMNTSRARESCPQKAWGHGEWDVGGAWSDEGCTTDCNPRSAWVMASSLVVAVDARPPTPRPLSQISTSTFKPSTRSCRHSSDPVSPAPTTSSFDRARCAIVVVQIAKMCLFARFSSGIQNLDEFHIHFLWLDIKRPRRPEQLPRRCY
jgi:hypothetical protein